MKRNPGTGSIADLGVQFQRRRGVVAEGDDLDGSVSHGGGLGDCLLTSKLKWPGLLASASVTSSCRSTTARRPHNRRQPSPQLDEFPVRPHGDSRHPVAIALHLGCDEPLTSESVPLGGVSTVFDFDILRHPLGLPRHAHVDTERRVGNR